MTWTRLDDAAPLHDKLIKAGAKAGWLWVAGICYANRRHTDGRVPDDPQLLRDSVCPQIRSARTRDGLIRKLLEEDLWHAPGSTCEKKWCQDQLQSGSISNQFLIHDYPDFQPNAMQSAIDLKRERDANRKRLQRGSAKSFANPEHVRGQFADMSADTVERVRPLSALSRARVPVPSRPDPIITCVESDRLLGIVTEADHTHGELVAKIFSEERARANMGAYRLPQQRHGPEWDWARHAYGWAITQAPRGGEELERAIRESVRGWASDEWVRGHRPPLTHWAKDPGKYLALYREKKMKADKELERQARARHEELAKESEAVALAPDEVEALMRRIGR